MHHHCMIATPISHYYSNYRVGKRREQKGIIVAKGKIPMPSYFSCYLHPLPNSSDHYDWLSDFCFIPEMLSRKDLLLIRISSPNLLTPE